MSNTNEHPQDSIRTLQLPTGDTLTFLYYRNVQNSDALRSQFLKETNSDSTTPNLSSIAVPLNAGLIPSISAVSCAALHVSFALQFATRPTNSSPNSTAIPVNSQPPPNTSPLTCRNKHSEIAFRLSPSMHIPSALNTFVCPTHSTNAPSLANVLLVAFNLSKSDLAYLQTLVEGTPATVDDLLNDLDVEAASKIYGITKEELSIRQDELCLRDRLQQAILVRIGSK